MKSKVKILTLFVILITMGSCNPNKITHYKFKINCNNVIIEKRYETEDYLQFKSLASKDSLFYDGVSTLGAYGDMPIKSKNNVCKVQMFQEEPEKERLTGLILFIIFVVFILCMAAL